MEQAALAAVRQWRFKPAMRNGVPISVVYHLSLGPPTR
jgi:outer membrane biosynthesis protein TonB